MVLYVFICSSCGPVEVSHPINDPHPEVCTQCESTEWRQKFFPVYAMHRVSAHEVAQKRRNAMDQGFVHPSQLPGYKSPDKMIAEHNEQIERQMSVDNENNDLFAHAMSGGAKDVEGELRRREEKAKTAAKKSRSTTG